MLFDFGCHVVLLLILGFCVCDGDPPAESPSVAESPAKTLRDIGDDATAPKDEPVKPTKCINEWSKSLCKNFITAYGKDYCVKNRFFGRYQCCGYCADAFHINVTESGTFDAKGDLKFFHPDCPNVQDLLSPLGYSWTAWCELWKKEEDQQNCEKPIFQYRCAKTCNVECGPAPSTPSEDGS